MTTDIKQTARDSQQTLEALADHAEAHLGKVRDQVKELLGDRVQALGKTLETRPMLAVGLGVGIGFLLARLLKG